MCPWLLCWWVMRQEITNNKSWSIRISQYAEADGARVTNTYSLCSSLLIMNEKQHFTTGCVDPGVGFFREQAVKRVSCAGSKAIVPNSSQYRTIDSSVRISCNAILP